MISERKHRPLLLAVSLTVLMQVCPAEADSGFVAPVEEIPLTSPLLTGARSLGMGGVGVAIADDATALTYNPAGLARLRRIEIAGSFRRGTRDVDGEMSGSHFESSISGTDISSFRAAYPFPTFRGSLVVGLSMDRLYDFTEDRLAAYEGSVTWDEDGDGEPDSEGNWGQTEDYLSDGGLTAWSLGAAVDVSPKMAIGATLSYLTGDYAYDFRWDLEDVDDVSETYSDVTLIEEYVADASGLRGTVGAIFYASDKLSFGMAVDSPVTLRFEGSERIYVRKTGEVSQDTDTGEQTVLFTDEITFPFAFRAGVAYAPVDLVLVGADVHYSDWSEMDYFGRITETAEGEAGLERRSLYDETLGYALGLEVMVPSWPLRLRGGYASRPIAYRGLDIGADRSFFTVGAGLLIDTVLALDVAWVRGTQDRSDDEYAFDESLSSEALILEATYRF